MTPRKPGEPYRRLSQKRPTRSDRVAARPLLPPRQTAQMLNDVLAALERRGIRVRGSLPFPAGRGRLPLDVTHDQLHRFLHELQDICQNTRS